MHKDIVRASRGSLGRLLIGALLVRENFESLAFELLSVGLLYGFDCIRLLLELDVGVAARQTISEAFKLALLDRAKLLIKLVHLLLGQRGGQVANQDIGFGIWLAVRLQAQYRDLAIDLRVIKSFLAR